jgi:polar amino acid transport system permease protein
LSGEHPTLWPLFGLGFNESAYTAETVRGGILSVDPGQWAAARAVGFSPAQTFRYVILPQAIKVFLPPFGNQVVNLLKLTSLVSIVALADLLYSAQLIYARTFETIPLLIVVSIWYLVVVTILSYGQSLLERRIAATPSRLKRRTGAALPMAGRATLTSEEGDARTPAA